MKKGIKTKKDHSVKPVGSRDRHHSVTATKRRRENNPVFEVEPIADQIIAEPKQLSPATTPTIRSLRRRFTHRLAAAERNVILGIAARLIPNPPYGRFVAYELICHHRDTTGKITPREVEQLGKGIASWDQVDTFACYIAGPAWLAGKIDDQLIRSWAHSTDRWKRRAALVSTVPLNSDPAAAGDPGRTIAVCQMLVTDRDDMVVKALSWALRKLSTRNRRPVEEFLANHRTKLASRIIREVENKLKTGLKNPRRLRESPLQ
jgi:3-methyladenine DNA glycosylase AlkD